jgi:hypothetical protein
VSSAEPTSSEYAVYISSELSSAYAEPSAVSLRRRDRYSRRQETQDSVAPAALAFLEDDAALVAAGNVELLAIALQQQAELDPNATDEDGAKFTAIMDSSNTYGIVGDGSGVLRFVDPESASLLPWATFDAIAVSDAQDRVLHYYPAQM